MLTSWDIQSRNTIIILGFCGRLRYSFLSWMILFKCWRYHHHFNYLIIAYVLILLFFYSNGMICCTVRLVTYISSYSALSFYNVELLRNFPLYCNRYCGKPQIEIIFGGPIFLLVTHSWSHFDTLTWTYIHMPRWLSLNNSDSDAVTVPDHSSHPRIRWVSGWPRETMRGKRRAEKSRRRRDGGEWLSIFDAERRPKEFPWVLSF